MDTVMSVQYQLLIEEMNCHYMIVSIQGKFTVVQRTCQNLFRIHSSLTKDGISVE
jgi:hypothetical protein